MRKLFRFTLGFAGALGCILWLCWEKSAWVCAAGWAAAMGLLLLSHWAPYSKRLFAAALGFALGASLVFGLQKTYYEPLLALDDTVREVEVLCRENSAPGQYSHSVRGDLRYNGKTYPVRLYLPEGMTARAGDKVSGPFRLRVTLPGGSRAGGTYPGSGIFLLASPKGEASVCPGKRTLRTFPQRLAAGAGEAITRSFPEDAAAFASSLLLGDTQNLSYKDETALRVSGIRHIVAVSGLHVAILFGFVWLLCLKKPWPAVLLGLPVLLLFAAAAGRTPSVCRACVMAALLLLARLTKRAYDSRTALAMAALCLMVGNPFVLTAAGFQLSVLSVLGILLFQRPLSVHFRRCLAGLPQRLSGPLADSLSVSLSAMTLSTPVSAYYFGTISLVGVVTNLLTLWLLPIIFSGILAVCLLGPIVPGLGALFGWLTAWPIRLVLWIAGALSKIPMAALYTCSQWSVYWLMFAYLLIVLWCLLKRRHGKPLFAVALAGLLAVAVLTGYGPRTDDCRLTVLDVGEGQCLLLQSGGESALIDCGGDSDTRSADRAWQMLRSQNFYRLDLLTLTHFDRDHFGGVANFLTQIPAQSILLPGEEPSLGGRVLTEDTVVPFGKGKLHFYPYTGGNSRQENSMAILFESENCVILVTGDLDIAGERRLLRQEALPKADILVAGHHGSKYATSQELLDAVKPELALISVGANNSYGHPTQEVLDRLTGANCTIRRTDLEGTIVIRRNSRGEKTGS